MEDRNELVEGPHAGGDVHTQSEKSRENPSTQKKLSGKYLPAESSTSKAVKSHDQDSLRGALWGSHQADSFLFLRTGDELRHLDSSRTDEDLLSFPRLKLERQAPRDRFTPPSRSFLIHSEGWPENDHVKTPDDPVSVRIAPSINENPTRQAETQTHSNTSVFQMVEDTPQRSSFWDTILSNHQAPLHNSQSINDDGKQSLQRPHGSQANASINPRYTFSYGGEDPQTNTSITPTYPIPSDRQDPQANASISPTFSIPSRHQDLEANESMDPTYPIPYGRQGVEDNASTNPTYSIPYYRQGLEANELINPAYAFSYGFQGSGANAYPPPTTFIHHPEHTDRQKFSTPGFCNKCDKPWHGFCPCGVESSDQLRAPTIPAKAVKTRPQPRSLPTGHLMFRCGICGEPGHSRTRCRKDHARKKLSARGGQKIENCSKCGGPGHEAKTCGERYTEFWERAWASAKREDILAATQDPTAKSAHQATVEDCSDDERKSDK